MISENRERSFGRQPRYFSSKELTLTKSKKKNLKTFRITFGHFQMSFPVHTLWLCILKLDNDIVKISKRFSRDTYQIKFFSTCKARLREKNATQPMREKVAFTKSRRWFNWLDTWLALKICQVRFYLSIKCTRVGRRFCKLQVAKNKIHFKAMITYENCPKISQNYFPYFTWIISTPVFRKITQIRVYEL